MYTNGRPRRSATNAPWMRLAEEEAENAGLDLNVLQQALSNCQSLIDRGCGDLGTQALIKFYEK